MNRLKLLAAGALLIAPIPGCSNNVPQFDKYTPQVERSDQVTEKPTGNCVTINNIPVGYTASTATRQVEVLTGNEAPRDHVRALAMQIGNLTAGKTIILCYDNGEWSAIKGALPAELMPQRGENTVFDPDPNAV